MKKLLQKIIVAKAALFIALFILSNNFIVKAQSVCTANFSYLADSNNPLLIHFNFTGTVPAGSFSFLGNWDFGDGGTSTDSCPSYLFSQPGNYTVCLSFNICIGLGLSCHDDTCMNITINSLSGIANPDGALHPFYSYPNPASSVLYIYTENKTAELIIESSMGQNVMDRQIQHGENEIDISDLSNGIYFVSLTTGKRQIYTTKLIVGKQ